MDYLLNARELMNLTVTGSGRVLNLIINGLPSKLSQAGFLPPD